MARGDRVRGVATRPIENSLQALLAARFRAQAQMVAALTDHPVLVGTGRESAVGALLQELLPRRFEVLTGVVAQLDENGAPRRTTAQADLMVDLLRGEGLRRQRSRASTRSSRPLQPRGRQLQRPGRRGDEPLRARHVLPERAVPLRSGSRFPDASRGDPTLR